MVEPKSIDKYITYKDGRSADDFVNETHSEKYQDSIKNQAQFFAKEAEDVYWHKKFTQVLDTTDKYLHRWFPDGEINICYNAVDRHVLNGHGEDIAFLEDSIYTGKQKSWSYKDMLEKTGKLASILKN